MTDQATNSISEDNDFEPPQLAIINASNEENLKFGDLNNSTLESNNDKLMNSSKDLSKSVHEEPKTVQEETNNCDVCNKLFKSKQTLKVHNDSIHRGIKFSCETCGKSFTQKSAVKVHMKNLHGISSKSKHENDNDESTNALDSILNHSTFGTTLDIANISNSEDSNIFMKNLKVEKSIKVEPEEIDPVSLLEVQLSTWMDEKVSVQKLHKCQSCEKSYNTKPNLRHHVRTVHEGKTHKCVHCDKEFTRPDFLKKHKKTVHEKTNLDENDEIFSDVKKIHKCKSCSKSYR